MKERLKSFEGRVNWLVPIMIPKKTKIFEFSKNFLIILKSIKNYPKKHILSLRRQCVGVDISVFNSKLHSGKIDRKTENFDFFLSSDKASKSMGQLSELVQNINYFAINRENSFFPILPINCN